MTAHREFAYDQNMSMNLYDPMLACNCYEEATDELMFLSHVIVERDDLKIGVIGIAELC